MVPWSILNWMILLTIFQPAVSVLQYSAVELLQFRFNRYLSPPDLNFYTDISKPRRKYIHRGSRRNYNYVDSNSIKSFWSSSSRSTRKLDRTADHSVLAHLGKSTITESTTNVFTFGLLNIRSINNKAPLVWDLLKDCKFDFFCLTETWQQHNDFSQLNQSIPPGFAYACQPRVSGRGGGLAMLYNKKWKVSTIAAPSYATFESMVLQVNGPEPTIITTVYRPPKFNTNFLAELSAFLTLLCSVSPNVIMVGDFNIHIDKATVTYTKYFLSCLDSFGLKQFIDFPTHSKGHTLDLLCCTGITPFDCSSRDLSISDHKLVSFSAKLTVSKIALSRTITFRNIKNIELSVFSNEVDNLLNTDGLLSLDELTSYYNDQLQNVLDVVAPVRTRIVSFAHTAPWYTSELRLLKAKGRQLERLYMRSGLTVHMEMYDHHIRDYKDALSTAKTNYYANLINSGGGNTKILFSTMNNMLRPPDAFSLHSLSNTTCDAFMNCFSDKIETIHKN